MARLLLFLSILFMASCNNNKTDNQAIDSLPDNEKNMKDLISQYPDSLLLRENLIQYYRDNGNYGQAIAEAGKAIKKDSGNARLWDIKGTLSYENEDTVNAIQDFEKAIALKPDPLYVISLATLYAQTRNPKAIELTDALLMADKAGAQKQAIFIKGLYYSASGEKLKAISFFNSCLSMDYNDMFAYREKAICYFDMAKYNDALAVLEKAVTVHNTFEEGYYWMGKCYEKLGKKNDAIENYQLALQVDPGYIEAKDALGKLGVVNQ